MRQQLVCKWLASGRNQVRGYFDKVRTYVINFSSLFMPSILWSLASRYFIWLCKLLSIKCITIKLWLSRGLFILWQKVVYLDKSLFSVITNTYQMWMVCYNLSNFVESGQFFKHTVEKIVCKVKPGKKSI